jgi:hypothetical protein
MPGDRRRPDLVDRRVVRWVAAMGFLIVLENMLLLGCMWSWIRASGAETRATNILLAVCVVLALAAAVVAFLVRGWSR